jgi:DNA-binding phage protein
MRVWPSPASPTDPRHFAVLFTRARLRKGWGYTRLEAETGLSRRTLIRACTHGHCSAETALHIIAALGIQLVLPQTRILTAQEAQHGL